MSGHISRELRSTNKKNKKSSKTKNTERTRKLKKTTKKSHKTINTEIETERVSQDLVQESLQTSTSGNSNLVSNTENTERSILGEKDANESQVLVDNIEQESRLEKNSNDTNNKQSFIWNYLEKLPPTERYKRRVKCLVKTSGQSCDHIMGSDGSTGNFIYHLTKHRITRDADLSQNNENVEKTQDNSAKKN